VNNLFDVVDQPTLTPPSPPDVLPSVSSEESQTAQPTQSQVESKLIAPQEGFQQAVLSSPADILVSGGAAGSGKTFALLLEPTRNLDVKGFGAVFFRRESPQITNEGGMWDESEKLYANFNAKPNRNELSWSFPPYGCKVRFSHMQLLTDRFSWDGSQIPLIGFDQLESFEELQFWYMLSRNRSVCGVVPYIRATCNPIPENDITGGWLHKLVSWWIDPETGYAIPERSGIIRWLVRLNDVIHWGDSEDELKARFPNLGPDDVQPKSFTFIPGQLTDNKILMKNNPEYRASLLALPLVERERLLGGNWKITATAGKVFNRSWFKSILKTIPDDIVAWVRYWDKAGTEGGGKYSAGVLMGKRSNGRFVLANVIRGQWSAHNREEAIKTTAAYDALRCSNIEIWIEQEPGSGGKESAENTTLNLAGHTIKTERVTGSKMTRSGPFASQCEAGNIDLLEYLGDPVDGIPALEGFLREAQNFDGVHGYTDQIDAAGGAFNKLVLMPALTQYTWGS
jgi:predicted phage terminase large subunit-like protein